MRKKDGTILFDHQPQTDESAFSSYDPIDNKRIIYIPLDNTLEDSFAIVHELMHDLTYSQYLSSNLLNEAFAEKLCEKICNQNSIPFTYSTEYTYNIWLYDTLENVFGTEQLMYMCYYGFLNDMIDLYTKKGYSNKLFNVLENLDYYEKNGENSVFKKQKCEKMLKTAEDIIVHLTHNYINDPKNNCDKEVVIANCKKMLVSDEDYFLKRLE